MLKALELSGFKSFADKTRFEFPPGITVVVGPNGSGKSNIVDAIKWVLGEQSAKSLRGKDMSDVIFKGSSGANARKPAGAAAATLILENADGRLMADAPEVHVTRRVYRSGESEYLINGQPCRLKDIRNLFRGTGVGTDAYSLIEQGKVDRLLQASAKDRRAIFEEAAGISRFKAKKIEAERRLERVEANLVRLADIVEEVGSRYRSIKSQAAKAARYREFTQRLQALRTYVGVKDFRAFSERIQNNDSTLAALREATARQQADILTDQSRIADFESRLDSTTIRIDALQEQISKAREAIAQSESTVELHRQRRADIANRQDPLRASLERAQARRAELEQIDSASQSELAAATTLAAAANQELQQLTGQLQQTTEQLRSASATLDELRSRQQTLQATQSDLGSRAAAQRSQAEIQTIAAEKSAAELAATDHELAQLAVRQTDLESRRRSVENQAAENNSSLRDVNQLVEDLESQLAQYQAQLTESRTRLAGITQRAKVIEELEKRLEGIQLGAKELLQHARRAEPGPLQSVIGLVADLLQVNVQHAALVDAALGPIAQYVVVAGTELQTALADGRLTISGRVTIVASDQLLNLQIDPQLDLSSEPEVIGPVSELVQARNDQAEFVQALLQGTWIVRTLQAARQLHERFSRRARFVTLDGEVIEADGTMTVGPKAAAMGLVSRRSELRALTAEMADLKNQIAETENLAASGKKDLNGLQSQVKKLLGQNQEIGALLTELAGQSETLAYQANSLQTHRRKALAEQTAASAAIADLRTQLASSETEFAQIGNQLAKIALAIQQETAQQVARQSRRDELEQQATAAKVALAKAEQQLLDHESRSRLNAQHLEESRLNLQLLESQLAEDTQALAESESQIALASQELATLAAQRELLASQFNAELQSRNEVDAQRRDLAEKLQQTRTALRRHEEQLNDCTVRARQLVLERDQLADRLREDYGLEVAKLLDAETPAEAASREEIDREITELRQKIGSIGAVNMQALAELEELEQRYQTLDQHYQDLANAKESLLKIIHKINNDSRRLFVETLEAIRLNFQKLFRQTFGGGQADIVLEEGVDVLEAGVEIIATPPGKPKFSNSLLSGGEKALTAVSLLMAIFQFRPSPFCVLDEVDAPFDEANIGRFIDVLKSFLGWTKFVIVTHSKKTMTAATTLYGITMQESGVSKRVSVKFEDVSDDGRISDEAVRRSAADTESKHESEAGSETDDRTDSGEDRSAVA